MSTTMLDLENISKRFVWKLDFAAKLANLLGAGMQERAVHAVDGVSLSVKHGEVVGLVGESGCGKSTLGRIVAGIMDVTEGSMRFEGKDIATMSAAERRAYKLAVQMIFQDPYASLNPRMRVEDIIGEAPLAHDLIKRNEQDAYVEAMLLQVGLDPRYKKRFPHQFSGGQRQRIGIARALAVKPRFIVCDEAVAALDVSIQAQVLNLFMDLREQLNLTYLFISHNLAVVEHLSDRVVIMYLGRVVESAPTEELFKGANHPYTQALLAEAPKLVAKRRDYTPISGEIPSPLEPPSGCHFHPRCPHAMPRCKAEKPVLREVAPNRLSACHLNDQA
ncbi:oligopeptide/dipeptide ABC transporter ATP-binding protein [Ferrovibrio sp.]|uniref:ABC transporter ATP-binding protein n=1 Tax=Ferrovibrio sp. TaxID=1917215 RepID=UPI001B70ABBA|nr:oligopeptide/dipeptide ABC transporter ATP-binding protein [Ferrovibrio sp.]MBP7064415.1 ATP-binding cassette domain-containing protein [Ferrovibrio sp.]